MCLPITLDVGTENAEFLSDPFYPGLARRRERGAVYEGLIEELFDAASADGRLSPHESEAIKQVAKALGL